MNAPAGRRLTVVLIVVLQSLQVLSLAAWLFATLFAGSALSEDQANAGTFVAVGAVFIYPLWLLGLGVATWVLWRRGSAGWALSVALLASIPVIGLLVVTAFVA